MIEMLQRVKLTIEYDGTDFYGWQKQEGFPTIQEEIEKSLEKFFQKKIDIFVAGRTDAGVHARGQVAHFDAELDFQNKSHSEYRIRSALNSLLKLNLISILNVEFVDQNFHARFSAKQKSYIYKIINRYSPTTIDKNYSWQVFSQLDFDKFTDCARCFIGQYDFLSFAGRDNQSHTTVRTIDDIKISKFGDEISLEFLGKSFLHNQIRIIVGTIKKITLDNKILNVEKEIFRIINTKNRSAAGETAPAKGLFLNKILFY
jgi:tRNA pseudouridine38-40 synthase